MNNIEKKLKDIAKNWFFSEPLLFSLYCTHTLVANDAMNVPMRTGQLRIEYSPKLLADSDNTQLEEYLKIEIYRILLQHPYKRQPYGAKKSLLLLASDVTINQFYKANVPLAGVEYCKTQARRFHELEYPLGLKWDDTPELKFYQKNLQIDRKTGNLITLDDLTYEQWYEKLLFLVRETSTAGESVGNSEAANNFAQADEDAELWEENEDIQDEINNQIKNAEMDQGWGGLGGGAIRTAKAQCDFSFDYRKALTQFRNSIVSANRKLTRMRPSRRYGFKAMGSRYERKANILIGVDVSGSITDESFSHFYQAINNFFFLGIIEKIDLLFFDVNLKNTKPIPFHKKIELDEIKGRGGTNFQPVIDYFEEHSSDYSGMILFTDGEGPIPELHGRKMNILWIIDSRLAFEKSKQWINTLGGSKATYLPF